MRAVDFLKEFLRLFARCEGLIQKLTGQGLNRALVFVFIHESGHTLLNLWVTHWLIMKMWQTSSLQSSDRKSVV